MKNLLVIIIISVSVSISAQIDSSKLSYSCISHLKQIANNKKKKIKTKTNFYFDRDKKNNLKVNFYLSKLYYDSLGRQTTEVRWSGGTVVSVTYFTYDDNNFLVETMNTDSSLCPFNYDKNKFNEHGDIEEVYTLNPKGKLISKINYIYEYDKDMKTIKKTTIRDSLLSNITLNNNVNPLKKERKDIYYYNNKIFREFYYSWYYNDKKTIVKSMSFYKNIFDPDYKIKYTLYDKNKNLLKEYKVIDDKEMPEVEKKYDDKNRLIELKNYDNGKLYSTYKYEYVDTMLTEIRIYNRYGENTAIEKIYRDSLNRRIALKTLMECTPAAKDIKIDSVKTPKEMKAELPEQQTRNYRSEKYYYDDKNRMIKREELNYDDKVKTTQFFVYDRKNLLKKSYFKNLKYNYKYNKLEYKYNSNGQLVCKKEPYSYYNEKEYTVYNNDGSIKYKVFKNSVKQNDTTKYYWDNEKSLCKTVDVNVPEKRDTSITLHFYDDKTGVTTYKEYEGKKYNETTKYKTEYDALGNEYYYTDREIKRKKWGRTTQYEYYK